jgi:hypothetical protein
LLLWSLPVSSSSVEDEEEMIEVNAAFPKYVVDSCLVNIGKKCHGFCGELLDHKHLCPNQNRKNYQDIVTDIELYEL